jgi:catechol 2,3-dioxygenase-like lactoylglutathione lyase family enzyme
MEAEAMFDHLGIGVTNLDESKGFFLKALAPLNVSIVMDVGEAVGLGREGKPSFWLGATEDKPAPLHIAFTAASRKQVDAFYRAAIAAGAQDNGPPGLRPHYHANYYGAFVIGPDGHNVEVVCHNR